MKKSHMWLPIIFLITSSISVFTSAKDRFTVRVAVHIILEKDGKMLLQLRENTGFADGWYSIVAGHIDGNETIKAAAIREAKEETGIDIAPQDLKAVHVMHIVHTNEYIYYFFTCKKWSGEIQNMEPDKCGNLAFFDKENLPDNLLPFMKQALDCINSGIYFSEYKIEKDSRLQFATNA